MLAVEVSDLPSTPFAFVWRIEGEGIRASLMEALNRYYLAQRRLPGAIYLSSEELDLWIAYKAACNKISTS